jgi:hypothetical protein
MGLVIFLASLFIAGLYVAVLEPIIIGLITASSIAGAGTVPYLIITAGPFLILGAGIFFLVYNPNPGVQ